MFYNFVINPIVLLYKWLYLSLFGLTGSYGISLLLMSVITFLVTSPFMRWAGRIQKNEKHIQDILKPQIDTIRSQSQGAEQHRRIANLYKSYAYHPAMAVRSVAGLAVQIPFLIAAYYMLSELPDIKGQSFLIINDLSKPDGLIGSINVLPILMTVINLMSACTTAAFAKKDKLQAALIAFLFLLLLYTAPSALLIFWTCNNLWGLLGNLWRPFAAKRQLTGFGLTIKGKTIIDMLTGLSYQFYVILALTTSFCLFVPIDIYIRNSNEFWFSLSDIIWMLLIACLLSTIILHAILKLIPQKARTVYICILFGAVIGFCLQSYIINTDYGVLDGNTIDWSKYQKEAFINSLIWILCILIPLFIVFFAKTNKFKNIILRTSQGLIIVQIISSIYMFSGVASKPAENYVLTTEKMFEISSNKNIIIFILDAFDTEIFQKVMREDPKLLDELDGFTYYPDTVGSYGQTIGALPQILTGVWYENKEAYSDYIVKAWKNNPFYTILKNKNYDLRIFTESIHISDSTFIDNITSTRPIIFSPIRFIADFYKLVSFRAMPHALKNIFWLYTGDLLKYVEVPRGNKYQCNDVNFYNTLIKDMLNIQKEKKCFRVYHLSGTHAPYTMNKNIQRVPKNSINQYDQAIGVMKIVEEYLRQIKQLNAYDGSIIVVMADHGMHRTLGRSPLLLFKGPSQNGKLVSSYIPVSFANLHASILAAMGENPINFGIPFNIKNDKPRRFILFEDIKRGGFESALFEYEVNGAANDIRSWNKKSVYPYKTKYDNEYLLGKIIDFRVTGNFSDYTGTGWGHLEQHLRWAEGPESTVNLNIPKGKNKNLKLIVDCSPYLDKNLTFQKIGVYVNNSYITSWKVSKRGRYIATIPSEINNNEKLNIKFTISNPEVSLAQEGRPIGLAVFQLVVDEADYNYKLGTNLNFNSDKISKYIDHGWDRAEPFGRWISGKEASLLLDIEVPKDKQLELRLKGFPYLVPGLENQVVGVYVNEQKIDTWYVNKNDWYHAVIPREIAKDGLLKFKFTVSDPEVSREKERRNIGLAVTDIILQEHKE